MVSCVSLDHTLQASAVFTGTVDFSMLIFDNWHTLDNASHALMKPRSAGRLALTPLILVGVFTEAKMMQACSVASCTFMRKSACLCAAPLHSLIESRPVDG